ncbi:MAG: hypothetical protein KGJ66_10425 [Alphaproteobacteria bacterium]|nr:hypothetical protein [Alphaproteobacteria bacterium]
MGLIPMTFDAMAEGALFLWQSLGGALNLGIKPVQQKCSGAVVVLTEANSQPRAYRLPLSQTDDLGTTLELLAGTSFFTPRLRDDRPREGPEPCAPGDVVALGDGARLLYFRDDSSGRFVNLLNGDVMPLFEIVKRQQAARCYTRWQLLATKPDGRIRIVFDFSPPPAA